MKRRRFTEEQIIGILKQAQAGIKIVDLCRSAWHQRPPSTPGAANRAAWRFRFDGQNVYDVDYRLSLIGKNGRMKMMMHRGLSNS